MLATAYITHTDLVHHRLNGHPERPGRIESVWQVVEASGLLADLHVLEPDPASNDAISLIHTDAYLERIAATANKAELTMLDPDTYALPISDRVARLAVGAGLMAVDHIMRGNADNALAAVRPPGHHATPIRPMGFCLYSNIAIAARYAQHQYGIDRVMIVDYDVHHGNGTQDAFYTDSSVLFVSSHQYPYYPGSGGLRETGNGNGSGYTVNLPLRQGTGNGGLKLLYNEVLWPLARRFEPQLILVSAGFDAHWVEPLASLQLDLFGYTTLTRDLIKMADKLCAGKIIFMLEGGYDLEAVGHGTLNIAYALQGRDEISDPLGSIDLAGQTTDHLIGKLQKIHNLA